MDETTFLPRAKLRQLQGLPATTELRAAVDRLKSRRDNGLGMFATLRALSDAQHLLADGEERDRLLAQRPAGCTCLGTGSLRDGGFCECPEGVAAGADFERRSTLRRAQDVRSFLEKARIPKRNANHTLESYPGKVPAAVKAWTGADGRGLFLHGETGTGKTGLAVALLRRYIEQTCTAGVFVVVPDLLDLIRDQYRHDHDADEGALLSYIRRVKLLVLDDLGTEKPSEWVEEKLYLLINHRYGELLPTIYTSNKNLKELGTTWHERIAWRIQESADHVMLKGANLRAVTA